MVLIPIVLQHFSITLWNINKIYLVHYRYWKFWCFGRMERTFTTTQYSYIVNRERRYTRISAARQLCLFQHSIHLLQTKLYTQLIKLIIIICESVINFLKYLAKHIQFYKMYSEVYLTVLNALLYGWNNKLRTKSGGKSILAHISANVYKYQFVNHKSL